MATMQSVVDLARVLLNDAGKDRYSDPDLLAAVNSGVTLAYRLRPDLFFATAGTSPAALALGDTFPLSVLYEDPVAIYAAGRVQLRDTEDTEESKAIAFTSSLRAALGVA